MSQTLIPRRLLDLSSCRHSLLLLVGGGGDRARCYSSAYSSSSPAAVGRRHQGSWEEESKAVKVSVWWDFENCHVPAGANVCRVPARITAALRASGIRGPVEITAFGDVAQLARTAQEALVSTGVCLVHVPHNGKNSSDRLFMADLIYWIARNPPPAHFFLISGDRDFANILHRLRMSNYNILLACPSTASSVLCSAATIMWPWSALVRGEDFSVRHYNHPPDGLHGSWYGHHKGALDDPFLLDTDSQEEECMRSSSELKTRTIPKCVANGIRQILYSYPEGVNLSDLRVEIRRNNITMDKDFFGYKKFSAFLAAMPSILKFIPPSHGESQPSVVGTHKRAVEPPEQSPRTVKSAHSNAGAKSLTSTQNEKPSSSTLLSSSSDLLPKDEELPPPTDPVAVAKPPCGDKETDVGMAAGTNSSPVGQDAASKQGLLERISRLWNGPQPTKSEFSLPCEGAHVEIGNDLPTRQQGQNDKLDGNLSTTSVVKSSLSHKSKTKEKAAKSYRDSFTTLNSEPCSSDVDASLSSGKAEQKDGSSGINVGLFGKIARWWRFGRLSAADSASSRNSIDGTRTDSDKEAVKESTSENCRQVGQDIFTKSYFWDALEQFLSTPSGSDVVLKSKTREGLMHELQKHGPWLLKDLKECDLCRLLDLLVLEKKWIEETTSKNLPFRLSFPCKRTCVPSHSSDTNGLSFLFTPGTSASSLQRVPEEEKCIDGGAKRNRPPKREEILSDCHRLLKELLKQYSEHGFNISIFKSLFAQKYGYEIDHENLGYPKLTALLQIMPGVRIVSCRILPAKRVSLSSGFKKREDNVKIEAVCKEKGTRRHGDDFDWEELGPISDPVKTALEKDKEVTFEAPSLSDEEFSDSENDADQKLKRAEEESPLLQILDSWYSGKDDGSSKRPQNVDGLVDCSRRDHGNIGNQNPGDPQRPKLRADKNYSFVSDSDDTRWEERDKLVESVLGSLRKAGNSRLHG